MAAGRYVPPNVRLAWELIDKHRHINRFHHQYLTVRVDESDLIMGQKCHLSLEQKGPPLLHQATHLPHRVLLPRRRLQ